LLPFLNFAYNFLNPSDVGVGAYSFTSCIVKPISFYDLIKTNEKMTSSMVKEQLNHFKFKKVIEEEAKNPLEWWRMHEFLFLYVRFVIQQILGIVGTQIEVEKFLVWQVYAPTFDALH
jgi:hypothetical protein